MKAISLWQPHATWIALGWKTIETRTHDRFKNLVDQRIAIHAAKRRDWLYPCIPFWKEQILAIEAAKMVQQMHDEMGHILCTAFVGKARWAPNVDCLEREEWTRRACCEICGRFCLFLDGIKPLSDSIPFRGRQGIFYVPDEIIPAEARE